MKKLFAALAFAGLVACGSSSTTTDTQSASQEPTTETCPKEAEPVLEAASGVCPQYAPRCCGILRPGGVCVGNCVARGAECP
jgi:hypothetical protein